MNLLQRRQLVRKYGRLASAKTMLDEIEFLEDRGKQEVHYSMTLSSIIWNCRAFTSTRDLSSESSCSMDRKRSAKWRQASTATRLPSTLPARCAISVISSSTV